LLRKMRVAGVAALFFLMITAPALLFAAGSANVFVAKTVVALAHIDPAVDVWVICHLLDDKQRELAKDEKQVPVKGTVAASSGAFPMQVPITLPASVTRQQVRQVRCDLQAEYLGEREAPSLHAKHSWAAAADGVTPETNVVKDIVFAGS